jgi:hypothetical protein
MPAGRPAPRPGSGDQIAAVLRDGHPVIDRFVSNTPPHAERRAHEMAAVVEYLDELGVRNEMSEAARSSLLALIDASPERSAA